MKEILVWDIYVADSDEQAWAEAGPEITRFWQLATENVWRGDSVTMDDLPRFTERFAYFPGGLTVKRLDEWKISLIGCPETVVKKARQVIATAAARQPGRHVRLRRPEPRAGDTLDRAIRDTRDAVPGSRTARLMREGRSDLTVKEAKFIWARFRRLT